MKRSDALLPSFLFQVREATASTAATCEVIALLVGVVMISLLAQVSIALPFTPVPVTGQTFGVSLIALLWGSRRGMQVIGAYLLVGAIGFPVFANAASGMHFGPTSGYLIGMVFSAWAIGKLSDLGWLRSRLKAWSAAQAGSFIVFSFGVFGLSFFVPKDQLFIAGVLPFLPGDLLKTTLSSSIAFELRNRIGGSK